MRIITALISCLLITYTCLANVTPDTVVQDFYTQLLKLKVSGLPNEGELTRLSPYLSAKLLARIQNAQKVQVKFIHDHPEEKPPLIEGALFCSLFEGISEFQLGQVEPLKDGFKLFVQFSYSDPSLSSEVTHWQDAVILKQEEERWVIEDIEYLGNWPFKPGNKLSEVLNIQ